MPVLSVPIRLPSMVLKPIGAGIDAVGDAVAAVARDDVAIAGGGPADGVVGAAQQDAVELIADGLEAAGVGADVVAFDGNADRRVLEVDAGLVARDDVGVGGFGAADERARAEVDLDAVVVVAQRDDAGGIQADDVPLDDGGERAGSVVGRGDQDAVIAVARDEVAGAEPLPPMVFCGASSSTTPPPLLPRRLLPVTSVPM